MHRQSVGFLGLIAGAALLGGERLRRRHGRRHRRRPGGSIVFDVSGEVLALGGYGFPPATMDDPAFVDGWKIEFSELLVTVDKITLSENPDENPGDESRTGKLVAEVDGPWAVDLHKGGPLPAREAPASRRCSSPRSTTRTRTAARPSIPPRATPSASTSSRHRGRQERQLDAQGMADYAMMQASGYAVLYVGTATFMGTSCTPATGFEAFPEVVRFKLGFKSPTTYVNCQNPDDDPAKPLGMEEHERGIIIKGNQPVTGQLTVHTDHPFWESFVHDSPAHFDMIAAQYTLSTSTPTAVLEDLKGVDPHGDHRQAEEQGAVAHLLAVLHAARHGPDGLRHAGGPGRPQR